MQCVAKLWKELEEKASHAADLWAIQKAKTDMLCEKGEGRWGCKELLEHGITYSSDPLRWRSLAGFTHAFSPPWCWAVIHKLKEVISSLSSALTICKQLTWMKIAALWPFHNFRRTGSHPAYYCSCYHLCRIPRDFLSGPWIKTKVHWPEPVQGAHVVGS